MTQSAPEGYKQANLDMVGTWAPRIGTKGNFTPTGPIQGRLIGGFTFKNKKKRMTTVYLIRISQPCTVTVKGDDDGFDVEQAERGDIVGVFHSGGLTQLQNLYGCMVWINPKLDDDGEFLTKALPAGDMKLYDVRYKGDKKKLPVEQRTPPENVKADDTSNSDDAIDYPDTDDDIPF